MDRRSQPIVPHYSLKDYTKTSSTPITVRFWNDFSGDYERHDHQFIEIQLCVKGHGKHVDSSGVRTFKRGDLFILSPGVWHEHRQCNHMEGYVCIFGSELLHNELSWTRNDPLINTFLWNPSLGENRKSALKLSLSPLTLKNCSSIFRKLQDLGETDLQQHRAKRLGYLLLLIDELIQHIQMLSTAETEQKPSLADAAAEVLRDKYMQEWNLDKLAHYVGVDKSYLVRIFRKATGLTPMAFLSRRRAELAAMHLLQSKYSIATIGNMVGWPDPNHFARCFRSHYSMSATEYRERFEINRPGKSRR